MRGGEALLTVELASEYLSGCPKSGTVVVRSPSGEELARRAVPLESNFPFYGLVSLEMPCGGRGQIRVPGVSESSELRFEVVLPSETRFSEGVYAEGPPIRVSELIGQPDPAPTPNGPTVPSVGDAVGAAARPILGWGLALGAGYLTLTNLDTIGEALNG